MSDSWIDAFLFWTFIFFIFVAVVQCVFGLEMQIELDGGDFLLLIILTAVYWRCGTIKDKLERILEKLKRGE